MFFAGKLKTLRDFGIWLEEVLRKNEFEEFALDDKTIVWYNYYHWFVQGEMAEWFKALVLKTSDVERHRGFESLSLRHFCHDAQLKTLNRWFTVEKYPSG